MSVSLYSEASRCRECGMKALLDERGARALQRATYGRLLAYRCALGSGWHVRRDGTRRPGTGRPSARP